MNFSSLFNQFRGGNSSTVNDLLDSDGITLDRLLDEDSFLPEYKSANAKVMDYMKYDKMQQLIKYVTSIGPANDKKKGYKYPLIASDVLSSDNPATIGFFFPDQQIVVEETQEIEVEVEAEKPEEKNDEKKKNICKENEYIDVEDPLEGSSEEESAPISKQKTMVRKMQKQVIQKQVPPLSDQLFSYFKGDVNYTLAGYVSKILSAFLQKKPNPVMAYCLVPENFRCLINHIESRSVAQFISKLVAHDSDEFIQEREKALNMLIERLSQPEQIPIMSNASTCFCEIVQKIATNLKSSTPIEALKKLLFTETIISALIAHVMSEDESVSVYNAPILMTYLTNVEIKGNKEQLSEFSKMLEQFSPKLKQLLKDFMKRTILKLQVNREEKRSLGFGRVKIVEIIAHTLKENLLNFREIAAREEDLLPTLFTLCRNYELNNILHNQVMKILDIGIFADDPSDPMLQAITHNDVLLNFILEEGKEDLMIRAGSHPSRQARRGYIGHIISLCQKLVVKGDSNPILNKNFLQNPQFQSVIENLVRKQLVEQNRTLAGYSMKRNNPQNIMFLKEQVIEAHCQFLNASPAPIYRPEPASVNIEHPDYSQTHEIQNGQEMERTQNHNTEIPNEAAAGESYNPKFWVRHIEYSVEDLMTDL